MVVVVVVVSGVPAGTLPLVVMGGAPAVGTTPLVVMSGAPAVGTTPLVVMSDAPAVSTTPLVVMGGAPAVGTMPLVVMGGAPAVGTTPRFPPDIIIVEAGVPTAERTGPSLMMTNMRARPATLLKIATGSWFASRTARTAGAYVEMSALMMK